MYSQALHSGAVRLRVLRLTCHCRKNEFEQSWVYDNDLKSVIDKNYRTSSSAMLPWDDPVALCLSDRMKSFLGNIQHIDVEPLQIVKFEGGERFRLHMDWFRETRNQTYVEERRFRPYNRLDSIFVYLEGNCSGGQTYFPDIKGVSASADGEKFARTDKGTGLLVKPKRGKEQGIQECFMLGFRLSRESRLG